jgi:hypothetical protein
MIARTRAPLTSVEGACVRVVFEGACVRVRRVVLKGRACDPLEQCTWSYLCGKQHFGEIATPDWVRTLRTCKHTHECVMFVNWLTQSGVAISPKCCFPHGELPVSHRQLRRFCRTHKIITRKCVCQTHKMYPPKRRFWNDEQKMKSGFTPLKSASKRLIERFVQPSKIFVWGAYNCEFTSLDPNLYSRFSIEFVFK